MMHLGSIPDSLLNSIFGFDEGASFQDQQPQQIINYHPQLPDHSSMHQEGSSSSSYGIPRSMDYSNPLASLFEKQRLEMEWLLQVENQRLRTLVQEKTRQQAVLLRKYEYKIMNLIRQKDKYLEIERSRSVELQNCLVRAQVEAQAFQKKAVESETMVLDLKNKLDQVREGKFVTSIFSKAQDAESFCESSNKESRDQEEQRLQKMMACKQCKERSLQVVFLPCSHLCSCATCEPFLALCPTCQSAKEGCLKVFWE